MAARKQETTPFEWVLIVFAGILVTLRLMHIWHDAIQKVEASVWATG